MNYGKEIEKLRRDIERANRQEEEARMTRYFAYQRIAELQHAARSTVGGIPHRITPEQVEALALEPPEGQDG